MRKEAVFPSLCLFLWIFSLMLWGAMLAEGGTDDLAWPIFSHHGLAIISGLFLAYAQARGESCLKRFYNLFFLALALWYLVCCVLKFSGQASFPVSQLFLVCCLSLLCPLCIGLFFVHCGANSGFAVGIVLAMMKLTEAVLLMSVSLARRYGAHGEHMDMLSQFLFVLVAFVGLGLFLVVRFLENRPAATPGPEPEHGGGARQAMALSWAFLSAVLYFTLCGMYMDVPLARISGPNAAHGTLDLLLLPLPLLLGLVIDSGKRLFILPLVMLACMLGTCGVIFDVAIVECCIPAQMARRFFLMVLLCYGWKQFGRSALFPLFCAVVYSLYAFQYPGWSLTRLFETIPAGFPDLRRIVGVFLLLGSALSLGVFFFRVLRDSSDRAAALDEAKQPFSPTPQPAESDVLPGEVRGQMVEWSDELAHLARRYDLNKREREIVDGLLRGLGTNEMASGLKLKRNTVRHYIYLLFKKTGVESRVQLVSLARSFAKIPGGGASS
jgi:DNA-binding CsgD family transcriptional regulator